MIIKKMWWFAANADAGEQIPLLISGSTLDVINRFVDVSFDPDVYHSSGGAALASDLQVIFAANGGTATAASISSITKTDGTALAGGENTVRVNVTITGTTSGVETIAIKASAAGSLKNSYGTGISASETTGTILLNPGYDTAYQLILIHALDNDINIPSETQRQLDSDLISDLKTANAWDEFDWLVMLGDNVDKNFALINWKDPGTRNATEVGTPTWTNYKGVKSSGTSYINSNFATATHGIKFIQNDASVWIFIYDNDDSNNTISIGSRGLTAGSANLGAIRFHPRNNSDVAGYVINRDSTTLTTFSNTTSNAMWVLSRESSTTNKLYKNGTEVSSNTGSSSARSDKPVFIAAENGNGTATLYELTRNITMVGLGSGMQDILASVSTLFSDWVTATNTVPAVTGRLYLLAGQSNMMGNGLVSDLPGYLTGPLTDCYIWWNGEWQQLEAGVNGNTSTSRFGPIISLAYEESQNHPGEELYFVLEAVGGTSLAVDWNPTTGSKYASLISKYDFATANMTVTSYEGFFWLQGEADALSLSNSNAYEANEEAIITAIFADTGMTKAIVANISSSYTYNATVRQAKIDNDADGDYGVGGALVETTDLNPGSNLHYNSAAYITLGERFSAAT